MQKRITLREIARAAGVHVTTVSLALRNHPRLPAATRDRIKALAEAMHYRPDPALASLMVYRQSTKPVHEGSPITYLTGGTTRDAWKKERSLVEIYDGAFSRAEARGYRLEEFWLGEPGMTLKRLNQLLIARGIESILISPWIRGRGHLRLDWSRFHCVKIGHSLVYPGAHTVENNQYQCMQLAMRRIRSKGYRRIGFATRILEDERLNHLYRAAFLVEQERFKRPEKIPAFVPPAWSKTAFLSWYKRHRPEVVICPDADVCRWLKSLGLSIPEDVGYVNLDCSATDDFQSGIRQPHSEVGTAAMDLLISLIHRNERGIPPNPHLTQITGQWVEGQTTR